MTVPPEEGLAGRPRSAMRVTVGTARKDARAVPRPLSGAWNV